MDPGSGLALTAIINLIGLICLIILLFQIWRYVSRKK